MEAIIAYSLLAATLQIPWANCDDMNKQTIRIIYQDTDAERPETPNHITILRSGDLVDLKGHEFEDAQLRRYLSPDKDAKKPMVVIFQVRDPKNTSLATLQKTMQRVRKNCDEKGQYVLVIIVDAVP